MPRKPKKTTTDGPEPRRTTTKKSPAPRSRKTALKRSEKQLSVLMNPKDMKALTQIADRMQMAQGVLAVLALSEIFRWFGAIYQHIFPDLTTAGRTRRKANMASMTASLPFSIEEMQELLSDTSEPPAVRRRGRPRKIRTEANPSSSQKALKNEEPPTVRRRGRPRKEALPQTAAPDKAEEKESSRKSKTGKITAGQKKSKRTTRKRSGRIVKRKATQQPSTATAASVESPAAPKLVAPVTTPENPAPGNDRQE